MKKQANLAKKHLVELYEYVHENKLNNCTPDKKLHINKYGPSVERNVDVGENNQSSEAGKNISRIERFMLSIEQAKNRQESPLSSTPFVSTETSIDDLLAEFEKLPRMSMDTSVLEYWETQKEESNKFHELYRLSQIVLATPARRSA